MKHRPLFSEMKEEFVCSEHRGKHLNSRTQIALPSITSQERKY
jgi:hypothetical protein